MRRPPSILYAEDEPDDVFFMQKALASTGISLRVVPDGEQAISFLSDATQDAVPPNLVLLDLNLPLRSGFEVLGWIRQSSAYSTLPVIVFSSSGRPEDRARAHSLGASGYLLKPSSGLEFSLIARELQRFLA